MADPLADYNSDEDEDYVPEDVAEEDEDNDLNVGQAGVRSKGRKRRRGQSSVSAPVRVSLDKTKNKGKVHIGAAVISSDDEEEEHEKQESSATTATTAAASVSNTYGHSGHKRDNAAEEESRPTSNTFENTPNTASSSAAKLPLSSSSPTSSSASSTTSLSGLMAQFNKKTPTAKPQVKKIINSWELPTTQQKPQIPPKPATAVPDQATANTATTVSISSSSSSTAPETEQKLSTEKVEITEFTSFAGETLRVTKTVIRGSAEDRAHRATDNLAALLSSLQQKKSINTLEKSRLDWDISKQIEGDEDDLKKFVGSKDAYVDKQAFLARAEVREHEKRKELKEHGKRGVLSTSLAGLDDD